MVDPTTTSDDLKQQALHLIHRAPSRRGSWAEATTSHAIISPFGVTAPPSVTNRRVPPAAQRGVGSTANVSSALPRNRPTIGSVAGPSIPTTCLGAVRRNDTSRQDIPQVGLQRPLTRVTSPSAPIIDALGAAFYHGFPRRRFVPPRRQAVTEEVYRELLPDDKEGGAGFIGCVDQEARWR